jgi:TolB protein
LNSGFHYSNRNEEMNKRTLIAGVIAAAIAGLLAQDRIIIEITGMGGKGAIAVPDLRGAGAAQPLMGAFNTTLWNELDQSGLFRMVPKTLYPLQVPQQPQEWQTAPPAPAKPVRRGAKPTPPGPPSGLNMTSWSGPPVNATYMTMGYGAEQGGRLVLFGWFYNVAQPEGAAAQVFGKIYNGTLDEAGAKQVAREFAADILKQFGATSLMGTKIIYVSKRGNVKEIWSMDYDGTNQRQITKYGSICTMPAVSPDGTQVAFTTFVRNKPEIMIHSLETLRNLRFYNQNASMNAQPSFFPDGKSMVFSSTAHGAYPQIYVADVTGANLRRITDSRAIDVEPKVNPKTGNEIVFVSGRSGPQQIYKMNSEGTDIVRLSDGEGEAANPAWHPGGQHIAFAWTRGFEPGNFNIFVMDVATRQYVQLTHGAGRNENPTWAPDGKHLVFSSRKGGSTQIYTMLADGTQVKQLTTQGDNTMPVWSK